MRHQDCWTGRCCACQTEAYREMRRATRRRWNAGRRRVRKFVVSLKGGE